MVLNQGIDENDHLDISVLLPILIPGTFAISAVLTGTEGFADSAELPPVPVLGDYSAAYCTWKQMKKHIKGS